MKKLTILTTIFILTLAFFLFAQEAAQEGEAGEAGNNFVTEDVTNFLIDDFEFANTWEASMPRDLGIISIIRREGGPADVIAEGGESNQYILGAKVEYFRSGYPWFSVTPPRPVKIPGITQEISVWVAGRNSDNKLSLYVRDNTSQVHKVGSESLTFMGWKNISVQVPSNIPQESYIGQNEEGIEFMGILVNVSAQSSFGKYYIYFDNIVAKTDMYLQTYKEADDPKDTW